MLDIELAIDIVYFIEILLNFVKKTRAHKELDTISYNYITGHFIFDAAATLPGMFLGESIRYYKFKLFRLVHVGRVTLPQQYVLQFLLQKYSKKRQNDLTTFAALILYVIYTSHIMACAWLHFGMLEECKIDPGMEGYDPTGDN